VALPFARRTELPLEVPKSSEHACNLSVPGQALLTWSSRRSPKSARLRPGAERQTCAVMDIQIWWEVVLRLFPEGAPVPYGTTLLDHVFSALWLCKKYAMDLRQGEQM